MSIRADVCAAIAAFGLVLPSPGMAQDRTDREVVDLIVRDGPQARAIRAGVEVTRREQLARLTYPNPSVMYTREGAGFTEFLQVEQSLPPFGIRAALSRAGVSATAAAEAESQARLWMLRSEAASAVARLTAGQDRQQAAESYVKEVERLIDVLRVREREGEGSRFDRLRAEQELHDARQAVTAAAVAVAEARSVVAAMLPPGTTLGRVAGATSREAAPPIDDLAARAMNTRAELRALERALSRADAEAQAARKARLPAPALFGGLKRAAEGSVHERGVVLGVSVSLPLFDAGAREAARWSAERTRVEQDRIALAQQVRAEIAGASDVLALRRAAAAGDQEGPADELMRIAEVAYREGDASILELLDALRTAARARTRSVEIRLHVRLAQVALERAVGDVLWP